jgi:hypothetical protein
MIATLIYLLIVLAVMAIIWWAISQLGLPPPVRVVAVAIFAIIALLIVARLLMGLAGGPVL